MEHNTTRRLLPYIISLLSFIGMAGTLGAQQTVKIGDIVVENDTLAITDSFLDSVDVKKKVVINDYTLIGVQYGVNMNRVNWNPQMRQTSQIVPLNFGVMYTRYGKMFGYMPYFGIQAGLFYSREGYKLKEGYSVEGADEVLLDVLEVPVMAHFHVDFWKMKLMVNLGLYGAYRLDIQRLGENVRPETAHSFLDTDLRWDYGIKGGAGFGFIFDPVEIHFNAMYKYGMGSLYKPNYYSEYYYRYAYAGNFVFSVSLHFQLTKRIGRTRHELRKEARRQIEQERRIGF